MCNVKLNPDCVRDLLLFLEENTYIVNAGEKGGRFHALCPEQMQKISPLNQYGLDIILYHLIQLSESGYIVTNFNFVPKDEYSDFTLSDIYYITPKGHEFSASMQEMKNWDGAKKILRSIGNVSLSIIESVSSGIASAAINRLVFPGQ